jgi:hypothetical protein
MVTFQIFFLVPPEAVGGKMAGTPRTQPRGLAGPLEPLLNSYKTYLMSTLDW